MAKKCIICEEEAQYYIKDTSDYYCVDCAHEQFGDLSVLVAIEQHAQALKKAIDKSILDEKELEDNKEKALIKVEEVDENEVSYTVNKKEED